MNSTEASKLEAFFDNEKSCHKQTVTILIKRLKKEINFKIKILKASIQLCNKKPFSVIAFRRSKPYFFIEFYSSKKIDTSKITRTIVEKEQQIINRINILSSEQIDEELLDWIKQSIAIAKKE